MIAEDGVMVDTIGKIIANTNAPNSTGENGAKYFSLLERERERERESYFGGMLKKKLWWTRFPCLFWGTAS